MPKSTVATALSGKGTVSAATRERVQATARELGYRPNPLAQRLSQGLSHDTVCIISAPLDGGRGTDKILLIQKELSARNLEVPLYTCAAPEGDEAESYLAQIQQVCRQRPRAIVCTWAAILDYASAELDAYQRQGGILISYDLPSPLHCDQVIFDREDNGYKGARHLLLQGHRQIGMGLSLLPPWTAHTDELLQRDSRLKGFVRALQEFEVPLNREWLFPRGHYVQGGAEMARHFLAMQERPTGICIVNDHVALAFMDEVMRAGVRVPDELSIVSYDNDPVAAYSRVRMTAVDHPVKQIVETVVSLVTERIEGYAGAPRTVTIKGELVSRQSVAVPPDQHQALPPFAECRNTNSVTRRRA